MLGKRKRQAIVPKENERMEEPEGSGVLEHAQEIFRRHFEAQFKPLPAVQRSVKTVEVEEDFGDESDWDGISDTQENAVQVVEHTDASTRMAAMSKEELKAFMSSKIPRSIADTPVLRDKVGATIPDDDVSEAANLKKDLALQRLLTESHLLDSPTNPTLSGSNRHKATDLRMQALGSKASIFKQTNMPMAHRKGILAKQTEKEEKRRKEARENGIVLEKAKMRSKKGGEKKRDRGVGGPGVGKFSGGTLRLSKRDVFDIEGPKKSGRGGVPQFPRNPVLSALGPWIIRPFYVQETKLVSSALPSKLEPQ
ncbi:hypothetical protein B7494_g8107 [Chlorociboria aeruginascens]|nr:hypothetical protein B7494_g8107 [Chlorociboria aeruginascens]